MCLEGQFVYGSNFTFLVTCNFEDQSFKTVYKPMDGERPLWDFPDRTLGRREVAAYLVSEALGWNLVLPTIFRVKGMPMGAGSVQLFIEHDPDFHYFKFTESEKKQLQRVMAFDILINNADRKGGHFLFDPDGKLWLIDHGLSFHVEDKLRTVAWDYAGQPVPPGILSDFYGIIPKLSPQSDFYQYLSPYLLAEEITALRNRATALVEGGSYPLPPEERRAYPWPLV